MLDISNYSGESLVLPDDVRYIAANVISDGITSLTIPDNCTLLNRAIASCENLESVTVGDNCFFYDQAIFNCDAMLSLTVGDNCSFYSEAVESSSLDNIHTGNNCTFDSNAFFCDAMLSLTVGDNCSFYSKAVESSSLDNIHTGNNCTFDSNAFCTSVSEISVGDNCTFENQPFFLAGTASKKIYMTIGKNAKFNGDLGLQTEKLILHCERPELDYIYSSNSNNYVTYADEHSISCDSVRSSTYDEYSSPSIFSSVDRLQEVKDSSNNLYAVFGYKDKVQIIPENSKKGIITISNPEYIFGGATIDENDYLYILWGKDIEENKIETAINNKTVNMIAVKYDLTGKVIAECPLPITKTRAQYPFDAGNANILVKDGILGCFFNTRWTESSDGLNHQGSEYAAIDTETMELIKIYDNTGSHSFGVTLIPTEYGFAGVQRGDGGPKRGINFISYSLEPLRLGLHDGSLVHASGQYGTNENKIDGNNTYLHIGGLAKSASTYAFAGKAEDYYTAQPYRQVAEGTEVRKDMYDVFVKVFDQTLASVANGLAGEERINVDDGSVADKNMIWLAKATEDVGYSNVKIVTLKDGSYCVLWEKINKLPNGKCSFDSVHYSILDECGNIIRGDTELIDARLSNTSIQPFVQGDTLTWAVANAEESCIDWYSFDVTELTEKKIEGDVNADGTFSVADVVLLQEWLLAVPGTHLADWKAGDLYEDDKLDVFDLAMLKRILLG